VYINAVNDEFKIIVPPNGRGNSMKPDFNAMSRAELLAYLKEQNDDEAWGIF